MPKQPRINHPVRQLRKIIGENQTAFAARVGISESILNKIENGARPITKDVAEKFMTACGVVPESVMEPYGEPWEFFGQAYTRESWQRWRNKTDTRKGAEIIISPADRDLIGKAQLHLRLLQRAAANKNRLLPLQYQFQEWLNETVKNFDLEAEFERVKKEKKISRLAGMPIIIKTGGGRYIKTGSRIASGLNDKPMSPALKKVAAAFKKERALSHTSAAKPLSTSKSSARHRTGK